METKTVDSRGRLALGVEFAGKTVLVKKTETGFELAGMAKQDDPKLQEILEELASGLKVRKK